MRKILQGGGTKNEQKEAELYFFTEDKKKYLFLCCVRRAGYPVFYGGWVYFPFFHYNEIGTHFL